MADPNIAGIKSSLLKAISDHMDTIEREGVSPPARGRPVGISIPGPILVTFTPGPRD